MVAVAAARRPTLSGREIYQSVQTILLRPAKKLQVALLLRGMHCGTRSAVDGHVRETFNEVAHVS